MPGINTHTHTKRVLKYVRTQQSAPPLTWRRSLPLAGSVAQRHPNRATDACAQGLPTGDRVKQQTRLCTAGSRCRVSSGISGCSFSTHAVSRAAQVCCSRRGGRGEAGQQTWMRHFVDSPSGLQLQRPGTAAVAVVAVAAEEVEGRLPAGWGAR
eukprot:1159491-Pelagomonas_calceolata.AAC.11